MSGVSGVSSNSASSLMQVLDASMQSQTDMAQKMIKVAAEEQVNLQKMMGIGQALDLYA